MIFADKLYSFPPALSAMIEIGLCKLLSLIKADKMASSQAHDNTTLQNKIPRRHICSHAWEDRISD